MKHLWSHRRWKYANYVCTPNRLLFGSLLVPVWMFHVYFYPTCTIIAYGENFYANRCENHTH